MWIGKRIAGGRRGQQRHGRFGQRRGVCGLCRGDRGVGKEKEDVAWNEGQSWLAKVERVVCPVYSGVVAV